MLCYAPYSIGQHHLHEAIVDGLCLEGIKRQQKKKRLIEASPLYPQSNFLGALVATGTAGGLITALINEILKSALK
jgi:hypothetical protein